MILPMHFNPIATGKSGQRLSTYAGKFSRVCQHPAAYSMSKTNAWIISNDVDQHKSSLLLSGGQQPSYGKGCVSPSPPAQPTNHQQRMCGFRTSCMYRRCILYCTSKRKRNIVHCWLVLFDKVMIKKIAQLANRESELYDEGGFGRT
jgi:hypothetical protein